MTLEFARPEVLMYGLVAATSLGAWGLAHLKRTDRMLLNWMKPAVSSKLLLDYNARTRWWKLMLRIATVLLIFAALAQPRLPGERVPVESLGIELIIAFDVSQSMLAEDVRPSRLEFAKREIEKLMSLLPGSRFGLMPFAGNAYLSSPMTTDTSALGMFLSSLSPFSVSEQGTSFSAAYKVAEEAIERGSLQQDGVNVATRVLLFVSDGEDHDKNAIELAKNLKEKLNVRTFTLAIGTEEGESIPIRDERGVLRGYLQDRSGRKIVTKVSGDFLQDLAQAGDGQFEYAKFGGVSAQNIANNLKSLEQSLFDSTELKTYRELYFWPLALSILLALFEIFWVEKNKVRRRALL